MLRPSARVIARSNSALNAWYDSKYAVCLLLIAFVATWTSFQIVQYWPLDLHPDVIELYAWGRHPSAGYFKHPPLAALMTAAWFGIFPTTNWAAHLMAMVNAALSLYVIDLIARRYLPQDKRLLVLLLLLCTPFYQFHAVRFGSNQTLLLTWPLAVYCFVRAFEARSNVWSIAAGAAAALAMLGKYYSIFLICGLVISPLSHPDRPRYLRSPLPWISLVTGLALLVPHLIWLSRSDFQPFQYATLHIAPSSASALLSLPGYLAGAVGYVLPMLIVFAFATRARFADMVSALWPNDPNIRLLAVLFWTPLLLPAICTPFIRSSLTPLWTMQGWFLMPILLLLPEHIELRRQAAIGVAVGVALLTISVMLASPAIAWLKHQQNDPDGREYYSLVAKELTDRWHRASERPLTIVVGELWFAVATTFYASDRPDSVPNFAFWAFPWVTPARVASEGFAAICVDSDCIAKAKELAAEHLVIQQNDIEVTRTFFGVPHGPKQFTILLVLPKQTQQHTPPN